MKKLWIVTVLFLWILAGLQIVQSYESDETDKIMEVLGSVGTMEQSAVVEYEGVLLENVENEEAFLHEIRAVTKGGTLKLVSQGAGEKQYLFINLEFQEGVKEAFSMREALEKFLCSYVETLHSSVNIIGSYSGKLTLEQRNRAADYLLEEMDAEIVSEYRDMELFTIYGYTPHIAEYQMQKDQPVNVNIAMYYDEEKDRTYVYAAVPVIGVEY